MEIRATEILKGVAGALDALQIPYLLGGSFASSAQGLARSTRDADLVIDVQERQVNALAEALRSSFYVSRDAMREALRERRSFNAIHLETGFKIDFFVLGDGAFDREEFRRRQPQSIGDQADVTLIVKTPEDTILRKLHWFRAGGEVSEQQWKDVLGVLAVCQSRLEEDYLDRWAADLGVSDLLARARQEAAE